MVRARVRVVIGLQLTKTRAELDLDSSTVFETNILRVSPVNINKVGTRVYEKPFYSAAIKP